MFMFWKKRGVFKDTWGDLVVRFSWIPPGLFTMGSPGEETNRDDDEVPHKVILTRGFYLQTTQVTQAQWRNVMKDGPSFDENQGDLPMVGVSWVSVTETFIPALEKLTGHRYRPPTEAQWEYACRAGTTTPFYFGKYLSTDEANYDGNFPLEDCPKGESRLQTIPVGSLGKPNAWGLHDMHGNIFEWCSDRYGAYPGKMVINPTGSPRGTKRILRGGSWDVGARVCRSAYRANDRPENAYRHSGFRLVLTSH